MSTFQGLQCDCVTGCGIGNNPCHLTLWQDAGINVPRQLLHVVQGGENPVEYAHCRCLDQFQLHGQFFHTKNPVLYIT